MDYKRFQSQFNSWYNDLPYRVSNMAVNDILLNFQKRHGSYQNGVFVRWKKRKTIKGHKSSNRALLIKSGRLWRSIRPAPLAGVARVITDVPYAQIHNEGGRIKGTFRVRAHKRTNTKRMRVKQTNVKTRRVSSRMKTVRSGKIDVKAHSRKVDTKIDQRQFMSVSPHFEKELEMTVLNELEQMFLNSM